MVLFRRTGRIYGGIHILVAPPSGGKSYIATEICKEIFQEGRRRIYSNYPIRTRDGKHCSYVWEPALMHENLSGQVIVLDEAHKYYWSRDFRNFTQEDKDWWSTTGHNEVTVYVLTQELARIDCIITDKATMIWDIEKIQLPILEVVICFKITQWPSKEAYQAGIKGMMAKPPIAIKYIFFKQSVADMYDTHFFKSNFGDPYIGKTWCQKSKEDGKPLKAPYLTVVQQIGLHIDFMKNQGIEKVKQKVKQIQETEQWKRLRSYILRLWSMLSSRLSSSKE